MSIKDTTNPSASPHVSKATPASVVGDVGLGPDIDTSRLTPEQAAKIRAQRAVHDAMTLREKDAAAKDLAAFLIALFLSAKEEPKTPEEGEDTPLSQNEDFIQELSTSFSYDKVELKETIRKVRSGEMTALEAARTTQANINPSSVDMKAAERAVAKYASSGNPLLELIVSKESGGNYNIAHNGTAKGMLVNLTGMTVNEVIAWQKQRIKDGAISTACGKYQIINDTLIGLKDGFAKKGEDIGNKLFDEKMQDRLGEALLERRGYAAYKAGKLPEEQFMTNLSKEWAALPKDFSGKSFYDKDRAGNKAHIAPAVLLVAMRASKDDAYQSQLQAQFSQGGVAQKPSMANLTASWKPTTGTDEVLKAARADATLQATLAGAKIGADAAKKSTLTT